MINLKKYNIILGSKSPRRSELLTKGDIPFTNVVREVDEIYPEDLGAEKVPEFLARLKSSAFDDLTDKDLLICADTIVIQNDKVIGKPKDKEDAVRILKDLADNWHTVISGVCMKTTKKTFSFSVRSDVLFFPLSDEEIEYYLETYQPYDKAGAYGIQDWIGVNKIKELRGSYTNIMGLPMERLYHEILYWSPE